MSPIIYLDFDKTLFDVSRYITQLVFPELARVAQVSLDEVRAIGAQYRRSLDNPTLFSPSGLAESIARQVEQPALVPDLEAVFHQQDLIAQGLFPEVRDTVSALVQTHTLRIFSQGVVKWQREKIEKSGIFELFDQENSIIDTDKTSAANLALLTPEAWIVDDKVAFLTAAQSKSSNLVLMDRPGETHSQPQAAWHGLRIASLTELIEVLKK